MERREKTAREADTAPMGLSIGALECVRSHAYGNSKKERKLQLNLKPWLKEPPLKLANSIEA